MKRLIWSAEARIDLASIAAYYADRDRRVGDEIISRINAAAVALRRIDTGRPGRMPNTREKSVERTGHVISYQEHDGAVVVLRVVHMARDWP